MADTQLPLSGVIICCTSIPPEQRSEIAATATQMGAVHRLDLTSDVTHLIVGDPDTPKYKFVARERLDVRCMLASWIGALRTKWLEGGEINVEELESGHGLPTFYGLRICVTGFDDLDYRKILEDQIMNNGGEYRGNLTKDITHLIAKEAFGQKYSYASQWNVKIVSVEWLDQSLERGMILEESLYHLALPIVERGKNAWIRRTPSLTLLGKRVRDQGSGPGNARKLRRTASVKLSSQNLGLWADINIHEAKPEQSKKDEWHEDSQGVVTIKGDMAQTQRNIVDLSMLVKKEKVDAGLKIRSGDHLLDDQLHRKPIFHQRTFLLDGFDERQASVLAGHLRSHGARIIADISDFPKDEYPLNDHPLEEKSNYLIQLVPHTTLRDNVPFLLTTLNIPALTEFWVERCLINKEFEEPQNSIVNTPFRKFPIPGFEKMRVCSTAFQGIDLLHVSKAVGLMGAKYEEAFTSTASVLICNATKLNQDKLRYAQLWGVPAVQGKWLWDSIRVGETLSFDSYLVQPFRGPVEPTKLTIPAVKSEAPAAASKADARKPGKSEVSIAKPRKQRLISDNDKGGFAQEKLSEKVSPRNDKDPPVDTQNLASRSQPRETTITSIHLDDDATSPPFDDSNVFINPRRSPPLREITPNSSPPKPSPALTKEISPSLPRRESPEEPTLGPAISSLLAHHQRTKSAARPQSSDSSDQQPRLHRRRRQLLGRAPSNLSSHSINLSRASSVDTMNTDGLGTPLEPSNRSKSDSRPKTKFPTFYSADQNDDPDREEPPLQMTQIGYEDPDVAAWRERVAVKMAGGKVKGGTTPGKGRSAASAAAGNGSLGISTRTRLATGAR